MIIDGKFYQLEAENLPHNDAINLAQALRRQSRIVTHGNYKPILARVIKQGNTYSVFTHKSIF